MRTTKTLLLNRKSNLLSKAYNDSAKEIYASLSYKVEVYRNVSKSPKTY